MVVKRFTLILSTLLVVLLLLAQGGLGAERTQLMAPADQRYPYQQWVDEAKLPTPDVSVAIVESPELALICNQQVNVDGCAIPRKGTIWLRANALDPGRAKLTLYHEIGHYVDYYVLPEWMRWRFAQLYGLGMWQFGSPEGELFANVYAECAYQLKLHRTTWLLTGYNGKVPIYRPVQGGMNQHNKACRMLSRLP